MNAASFLNFDFRVFEAFNGLAGKSSVWDAVFVFFAQDIIFLLIAGLALFIVLRPRSRERMIVAAQGLLAAFIGRTVIASLIRAFFFRPRPFLHATAAQLIMQNPAEASFPSGHASVMFALAFSLFFTNPAWALGYLVLAVLSGLARVVVGVHYPFDIVGGMLAGALSALIAKWIFDFWVRKAK